MQKLVIWDFDGVITDTESLLLQSRIDILSKNFQINWDMDTIMKKIGGMGDKEAGDILKTINSDIGDNFWKDVYISDVKKIENGLNLTDYIENIFKNKKIEQCIATGGVFDKTKRKIKSANIEKYFPDENIFTIDMVEKGKPEPDIFLLAAKKMGYKPENCIVIEDSVAGLTAVLRAGMTPVAFVKYSKYYFLDDIKKLGIKNIFEDMRDVENFILENL
ncbi:MAG: HAD family phosphatase [Alphaproteobacteria bacterium]|nr:HAD family phosphatase [Alphaproteobacteria bacterium]